MKKSIFLYLFILTFLMLLFTFMYFNKKVTFQEQRFENFKTQMNDSINVLNSKWMDAGHFSLPMNDNAQNYLENYSISKLIPHIENKILELNENPEGNPLTGYEKIDSKKFLINKIQVLNHRWIIADYSNGDLWGEVLIKYFIEEDENITFEIIQTVLYPKQ
ncbi:hypothetical protein [Flavobacterium sp.]|uniref:hypothetical protein n=1 Tax=Flavobacterium sp. TaxID=239 RepID=UPI002FDACA3A